MDSQSSSDSDRRSSTSSSVSDDDLSQISENVNEFGLQPYQFEPQRVLLSSGSSEEDSEEVSDEEGARENSRLTSSDWCKCGDICQAMDSIDECVCCQEIDATQTMCSLFDDDYTFADKPAPQCITQHPGFAAVCLNKWVLRTAWLQYKQQYKDAYEGPEHKQFRHIAYRQLARWCWGVLGKDVRVVLPSCSVMCIRAHFPPPGLEEYLTFEGFHFADE